MKKLILLLFVMAGNLAVFGQKENEKDSASLDPEFVSMLQRMDSIEKTLHYKTGTIVLGDGIATINVPEGFKFLESKEADYVLVDLWGNLRGSEPPLGMLFPANSGATAPGGYAFIIQYESIGYVKDKDADKIDYEDLLKEIKDTEGEENAERKKLGLETMEIVGWAAKPYYDKDKKLLHWAKEFKVSNSDDNTLNYDIRLLGRKGVLNMQAIASMDELDSVKANIDNVLHMVSFNPGNTYADFDSKTDNVAAWTIGGLVAGKVLAKVGFFALIVKNIKLIALGLVAVGGFLWRFITGRRKKQEEFVYEPAAPPADNSSTPIP
jgi:uncharacterized membrane-anchored protein